MYKPLYRRFKLQKTFKTTKTRGYKQALRKFFFTLCFLSLISLFAHVISAKHSPVLVRQFLCSAFVRKTFLFILQEVITQGRELAERANEMSTKSLRDKRPLQTASTVLLSDLTSFSSKVEHIKRWLDDAVNFYNLLNKVRSGRSRLWLDRVALFLHDLLLIYNVIPEVEMSSLSAFLIFTLGWLQLFSECSNSVHYIIDIFSIDAIKLVVQRSSGSFLKRLFPQNAHTDTWIKKEKKKTPDNLPEFGTGLMIQLYLRALFV